jgi:diguanylate cyclase (GGDEF)-like protein
MAPAMMIGLLVGIVLGAAGAYWLLRRRGGAPPGTGAVAGPHLLPDPALRWLIRAYGALGVWVTELDPTEEGPRNERVIDADRLSISQITAVDRRLERARDQEQDGVERMEGGTLAFHSYAGIAVGLLLPETVAPAVVAQATHDLRRLLEGIRRRPQFVALAQAGSQEGAIESVESVGMRLAYQLERIVGGDALIAAAEPGGARIVGVSGRADRRLLGTFAAPDSPVERVARGRLGATMVDGDPVGGVVADRRQRQAPVTLLPLAVGGDVVGTVAIWAPGGEILPGQQTREVQEAVAGAGGRMSRALEAHGYRQAAEIDPLTGLVNRRGFERVLGRHDVQTGALVYCDLDKFKSLNDTLGHPAGDAAIAHFARVIREQIRGGDTAARIGGEEFAVWLPEAGLDLGVRIAERIRVKLGTTAWDWQGRHWPLSASFGVAACPETSRRIENLAGQADAALYVAKKEGRNRVEAAGTARAGG